MKTQTLEPRLAVRVQPATLEQLRRIAQREEVSVGAIVRRGLRMLLAAEAGPPNPGAEP